MTSMEDLEVRRRDKRDGTASLVGAELMDITENNIIECEDRWVEGTDKSTWLCLLIL